MTDAKKDSQLPTPPPNPPEREPKVPGGPQPPRMRLTGITIDQGLDSMAEMVQNLIGVAAQMRRNTFVVSLCELSSSIQELRETAMRMKIGATPFQLSIPQLPDD